MKTPILAQIAEAFALSAFIVALAPVALPALAIADGAHDAYLTLTALYMCLAWFAALLPVSVLLGLSSWLEDIAHRRAMARVSSFRLN